MKNRKAMPFQRPRKPIKKDGNDNRVNLSWRVFKIVNFYVKAVVRWIREMDFKVDFPRMYEDRDTVPPFFKDLSMLMPIFKCLCWPDWQRYEMVENGRFEMPRFSYYVDSTVVWGRKQDEEESKAGYPRKLYNQESIIGEEGQQGDEESAVDIQSKKNYRVEMRMRKMNQDTGTRFQSIPGYDHKHTAYFEELGLKIVDIARDGNCMFRALADQLCGDQELHKTYRQKVVDYMIKHPHDFADFFEGDEIDFQGYCEDMACDGEWGDNLELQAASLLFKTNIHLYVIKDGRIEITNIDNFHGSNAPAIRLSYHNGSHYNSLHVKTEDDEVAQQATNGQGEVNDTEVTSALPSYPGIEKYDQNILRLVLKETIGSATIGEAIAALELYEGNPDDAIKYLLGRAVERLAKGVITEKLYSEGPPLLSSVLPYQEEYEEDTVRWVKAQTLGMANSARIQDALKLMNGDLGATIAYIVFQKLPIYASGIASYAGKKEIDEELERERQKDQEAWADKLKQHFAVGGSIGDNSIKYLFDNCILEATSILSEPVMVENKEINLECKALDDNEEGENWASR